MRPIVIVAQKNENAIQMENIMFELSIWSCVTQGFDESLSNSLSALTVNMAVTHVTTTKNAITAVIMARFRLVKGRVRSICHVKLSKA